MKSIGVLTIIGNNGIELFRHLRKTAMLLASGSIAINWYCVIQDGYGTLANDKQVTVLGSTPDMKQSSLTHGTAINNFINFIKEDYVLIVDADVIVLMRNWDLILTAEITSTCCCIGLPNDSKYGYQNFPCVIFLLADTKLLLARNIDFRPDIIRNRDGTLRTVKKPIRRRLRRIISHSIPLDKDTGYLIKQKVLMARLTGKAFTIKLGHHFFSHVHKQSSMGLWNGVPVIAHLRKSAFASKKVLRLWADAVRKYFKKHMSIILSDTND